MREAAKTVDDGKDETDTEEVEEEAGTSRHAPEDQIGSGGFARQPDRELPKVNNYLPLLFVHPVDNLIT